jgi:hypothetical protein
MVLVLGVAAAVYCVAVAVPFLRADETIADRRARIENLDPLRKEDLLRRQKRFAGLDETEQDRLRRLHQELEKDPDQEELRQRMHRYCQWMAGLSSYERAELLQLPPEERIEKIKKLLEDPERKGGRRPYGDFPPFDRAKRHFAEWGFDARRRPNPEDFKAIHEWFNQFLEDQVPELIENLPEPRKQQAKDAIESADDPARRRERLAIVWMQWWIEHPAQPPVDDAALADLRSRLSQEMRDRWEAFSVEDQRRMVVGMLRFMVAYRAADRRPDPALPLVEEKELARFFQEDLTAHERDRLLNLPNDEMRRELRQEYLRWRLQDKSPRVPSWPNWRHRPGPGGPPHPGQPESGERPGPPPQRPPDDST